MIHIMSFGYKYTDIPEGYMEIDCRKIRNPFTHPTFKGKTWLDAGLQGYVIEDPRTAELLWRARDAIGSNTEFSVAFGCVGGSHRSVILAELLKDILRDREVKVIHRDLEKL